MALSPPPVPAKSAKATRVTLTKSQAASDTGRILIEFLMTVADDGQISVDEVRTLHAWVQHPDVAQLPAVVYLREIVSGILADGKIDADEFYELRRAIQRTLPKEQREDIIQRLKAMPRPATEKQIAYIQSLGGHVPLNLTLDEASNLIGQLIVSRPPTPRQTMVLRFWSQLDLYQYGKDAVSAWMDEWYSEDPDRLAAWELFKRESHDDGSQRNPDRVPVNIGWDYLKRIKGSANAFGWRVILVLSAIIVIFLAFCYRLAPW